MDRFDLWRFFGPCPEPPEEAYISGPDVLLEHLKTQFARNPGSAGLADRLCSAAFRFNRLDVMNGMISTDEWENCPGGTLWRGRIRYFLAIAASPDKPDVQSLESAAADFRGETAAGAAGLIRVEAAIGGDASAGSFFRRHRLRSAQPPDRYGTAAHIAALALFMAYRPGIRRSTERRRLLEAAVLTHRCPPGAGSGLLRAGIEYRLGRPSRAVHILTRLAGTSSDLSERNEAVYLLLHHDVEIWKKSEPHPVQRWIDARSVLLERLNEYGNLRPADPRVRLLEGELRRPDDEEGAGTAWRRALELDEREAAAWMKLADLYRESWERGVADEDDVLPVAAAEAALQALTLEPLNPEYRLSCAMVELESGRAARAVTVLTGALALVRDDRRLRRALAESWSVLADSDGISPAVRSTAAGRAADEWRRLAGSHSGESHDTLGYLQAIAMESYGDDEKARENLPLVRSLLRRIVVGFPAEEPEDLVVCADHLQLAGFDSEAALLLDVVDQMAPDLEHALAVRAAAAAKVDGIKSMDLYLRAAELTRPGSADRLEYVTRAADIAGTLHQTDRAERILRGGLMPEPGNPVLIHQLTELLAADGRTGEALETYRQALHRNPDDASLVEDASWFFRGAGENREAEDLLHRYLERYPEDGRIWNQLGVHYMETGWSADGESIDRMSLELALEAYGRAAGIEPDNPVIIGNLGDALRQAGREDEAEEILLRAAAGNPDVPDAAFAVNSLARLRDERSYTVESDDESRKEWEEAGNLYLNAARIGFGNPDFQRDCAWWLYRERRLQESLEFYRRAAELDPDDADLVYGEYQCHRELGDEIAALDRLKRAVELDRSDPMKLADLADLTGSGGDAAEAERIYLEVLRLSGQASWVWERLAALREERASGAEPFPPVISVNGPREFPVQHLMSAGTGADTVSIIGDAIEAWDRALAAEPAEREYRLRKGSLLRRLGRLREAREMLVSAIPLESERRTAAALHQLGLTELAESVTESDSSLRKSAIVHLAAAVELDDLRAGYHAAKGWAGHLDGADRRAFEAFMDSVDRDPANPWFSANAGICAYRAGLYEQAVTYLRRAVGLRGGEGDWYNALGLSLLAAGDDERAVEFFRHACLADPSNSLFPANLALAHRSLHAPRGPLQ